jgi:hypothetical protein
MAGMVPVKDPITGLITFYAKTPEIHIKAEQAQSIVDEVEKVIPTTPVKLYLTPANAPQDKDDVAGVDYDPYGQSDAGGSNQYDDIHKPSIPFHNFRQIHVTIDAVFKGYNSTRPLPAVPPLWGDVTHYWNFGVLVGYGAYELIRVFGGIAVTAITVYAASKGIVAL